MNDDDLIQVCRDDLRDLLLDAVTLQKLTTHEQRQAMWAAVNAPVSPVVPLTALREWIDARRELVGPIRPEGDVSYEASSIDGQHAALDALTVLLSEYERKDADAG